jgi:hypothetical protein
LQGLRELQHTAKPAKSISLADFSLDWDPSQMAGPFSSALSFASSSTHARRLKQRPDIAWVRRSIHLCLDSIAGKHVTHLSSNLGASLAAL